jgi:diguanylate cyclase (GGDEF)-like protein
VRNRLHKQKIKLATLLAALVTASVVSTLIVLLISSYHSQKESLVHTSLSLNYSKSKNLSSTIDSLFKNMRSSLENTANYLGTGEERSAEDIQLQLEILQSTSRYFNSLSWVDETGVVQNIAPISVGLKGQTVNSGPTNEALNSRKPSLSPPYYAASGRLIVLMSHPIYDKNGKYRGIIGGSIYLQEKNILNEIVGNNEIDSIGSYFYVIGPKGDLLFHPDKHRLGEVVSANPIVSKLAQGKSGMEIIENTKGVPMLAAYTIVPEIGWGVVQQTPVSSVNVMLMDHTKKLILYTLAPFIMLLLFSVFIARKLASPFMNLANLVNRLSTGETISIPKKHSHWNREVDLLTKSVIIAIQTVQKNTHLLKRDAYNDQLTGLANRRSLDETLQSWSKDNRTYSIIVLDIDHFKSVNDTYGHQAGDEVLKHLGVIVSGKVRSEDRCFRFGGEEFVVLLPNTTASEAFIIAEDIRAAVEHTISPIGKAITISLGIAEFPVHAESHEELFRAADRALYESKTSGRNRTTCISDKIDSH